MEEISGIKRAAGLAAVVGLFSAITFVIWALV